MTVLNEGKYTAEFLLSEGNGTISRDQIVIAAAAGAMVPGTLIGKITASGKWAAYNNANADGTEVARGVLYAGVPDIAVDQPAVAIVREAEVQSDRLTGVDAPGTADLAAIGVIVR
jgi:uncharacterized protein YbjT (DUF2867 family)